MITCHIIRRLLVIYLAIIWSLCDVSRSLAQETPEITDAGELHRLIQPHLPHPVPEGNPPKDSFDVYIPLSQNEDPVLFSIPGFHSLGCIKCHKGERLHVEAAERE